MPAGSFAKPKCQIIEAGVISGPWSHLHPNPLWDAAGNMYMQYTSKSKTLLVAWDQASELQGAPPDSGLFSNPVQLLLASCTANPPVRQVLQRRRLFSARFHATGALTDKERHYPG